MSTTSISSSPTTLASELSAGDELAALGWEINANQYRIVHAAARFDVELEWVRRGYRSASGWISTRLQVQTSTAAEWVRVGHALQYLPLIDAAFAAQEISYAKVRILTRWADDDNEAQLLGLARQRTAGRLTVAIAKVLADGGDELVRRIAETPTDEADEGETTLSADRVRQPSVTEPAPKVTSLRATLRDLRQRWQPDAHRRAA